MRSPADNVPARRLLDSLGRRGGYTSSNTRDALRMQLVLVLPGLLESARTGPPAAPAPALAELLAWAGAPSRNPDGLDAEIASRYGVARQTDWPLAAIRAASLGLATGDDYWLAADPVTLVVGRDDVAFSGIVGDLTHAQAAALVATLNAHFAGDGFEFVAPKPNAIFARLAAAPRLATHQPALTPDRPLRFRLPEGADAAKFRRWQSEIQMLLHEHPVNVEREKSGAPPVNGLWLSAGGLLPPRGSPPSAIRTYANSGIAVALAAQLDAPARPLPAHFAAAIDSGAGAKLVVVALASGAALTEIERAWALPSRDALASRRVEAISIVAEDAGDAVCWRARRPGVWQRFSGRVRPRDIAAELAAATRKQPRT